MLIKGAAELLLTSAAAVRWLTWTERVCGVKVDGKFMRHLRRQEMNEVDSNPSMCNIF